MKILSNPIAKFLLPLTMFATALPGCRKGGNCTELEKAQNAINIAVANGYDYSALNNSEMFSVKRDSNTINPITELSTFNVNHAEALSSGFHESQTETKYQEYYNATYVNNNGPIAYWDSFNGSNGNFPVVGLDFIPYNTTGFPDRIFFIGLKDANASLSNTNQQLEYATCIADIDPATGKVIGVEGLNTDNSSLIQDCN